MSATTHLVDVSSTGAVADAVTAPATSTTARADRLLLPVTLAVVLGVVAAILATWALVATQTLHMSF